MLNHSSYANNACSSHCEILMRCETLTIPALSGRIESMYPIDDRCRIDLIGSAGKDDEGLTRWQYRIRMPLMCITQAGAACTELTFYAELNTPFSEEKMRFGCQLHADCAVYPQSACETDRSVYCIAYNAHISLYASCFSGRYMHLVS